MAYRDRGTEKEEPENYWGGGQHGNKEEYEKYLLIKSRLEGKAYRSPSNRSGIRGESVSLLSFYPHLKWIFALLFFVYVTQIAEAYLKWGLTRRFAEDAFYWGAILLAMRWYFIKRDPGKGSVALFDQFLPNVPILRSLPYWVFLLSCLVASLEPNDFKVWAKGVEHFALSVGSPVDCDVFLSLKLPRMPLLPKFVASLSVLFSGGILVFDLIAFRVAR
ncbi:MAG: hypothetical protein LBQ42_13860 [Synergistaceae bacterium]|jgi:hypothetical protein|nr:hypothetical protein [Synergistaceae bacterium]